jgi:hypothetical protein
MGGSVMSDFEGPTDLKYNRGLIADPDAPVIHADDLEAWVAQGLNELS